VLYFVIPSLCQCDMQNKSAIVLVFENDGILVFVILMSWFANTLGEISGFERSNNVF